MAAVFKRKLRNTGMAGQQDSVPSLLPLPAPCPSLHLKAELGVQVHILQDIPLLGRGELVREKVPGPRPCPPQSWREVAALTPSDSCAVALGRVSQGVSGSCLQQREASSFSGQRSVRAMAI